MPSELTFENTKNVFFPNIIGNTDNRLRVVAYCAMLIFRLKLLGWHWKLILVLMHISDAMLPDVRARDMYLFKEMDW